MPNEPPLGALPRDRSNGYEAVAAAYIARRGTRPEQGDAIGVASVRRWAETLEPGACVLDLGCGPGEPVSRVLHEAGLQVFGVDASPTMVAAFRARFPRSQVECNSIEASNFFGRTFAGVVAWGLLFLLEADVQELLIRKVGAVLEPGGAFLFTAHTHSLTWLDAMTGRRSQSLGARAYERLLRDAGMRWVGEDRDEGENHYYFAVKARVGRPS